ncbi:MAG: hypothetical protein ACFCUG_03980 [Thiotrichales bacterium]
MRTRVHKTLPLMLVLAVLLHLLPFSLWGSAVVQQADDFVSAHLSEAGPGHHEMAESHGCCDDPVLHACDGAGSCGNPACQCPVGLGFAPIAESPPIDPTREAVAMDSRSVPIPASRLSSIDRPPRGACA